MRGTRRPGALPILLARFSYFLMEIGLTKSFGVLVPELEVQLQASNAVIGLVTSLSLATMYLGSPIAQFVVHGCSQRRLLTAVSGLIAGCSLIGTAFTRNVVGLSFLFLAMGLCCSVISLRAITLLFDYYQEDYPIVSCISVIGIPVGAAILPPVTEKLLEAYGLSGSLLIIGTMTLNLFPIGLLLKERTPARVGLPRAVDVHVADPTVAGALEVQKDRMGNATTDALLGCTSADATTGMQGTECDGNPSYLSLREDTTLQGAFTEQERKEMEVFYSARTESIQTTASKPLPKELLINATPVSTSSKDHHSENGDAGRETLQPEPAVSCLRRFHLAVLVEEPLFLVLFLPTIMLLFLVTGGWALFTVLYAVDHGIELSRAAYLPTTGAVGGIVSSVLLMVAMLYRPGWSPQLYVASLAVTAGCCFGQTLHSSYPFLMAMSFGIGFGLFGASLVIEAVMARTVQPQNFSEASSLFLFAIGAGYILSGYLAGFVLDETGDVKMVFIYLGAMTVVAIVLLIVLLICLRRKDPSRYGLQEESKS